MLVSQEATCLTDVVQQAYQQLMCIMLLIPFEDGIHFPVQFITVSVHYIINAASVKLEVSNHTPWKQIYRREGKRAYNLSSIMSTWQEVVLMGPKSLPSVHLWPKAIHLKCMMLLKVIVYQQLCNRMVTQQQVNMRHTGDEH